MSNFLIGYYYYFFCLVVFFGITYYLVTYVQYKKYYLSKFFIILISAVVAYLSFYFFFIYGVNTQLPDVTALLSVNDSTTPITGTLINSSNSNFKTIQIFTMLLVFLTIMYYVLRNLISTISELLIDYMDPERDVVMKLFKVFFYTLMFILFPYLVGDVIILSLI